MLHILVNNSIDYHTVRRLILLETKQKLNILLISLVYQSVVRKIPLPLGRLLGKNVALESMLALNLT